MNTKENKEYEKPSIKTYTEDEILDLIGPANTAAPHVSVAPLAMDMVTGMAAAMVAGIRQPTPASKREAVHIYSLPIHSFL